MPKVFSPYLYLSRTMTMRESGAGLYYNFNPELPEPLNVIHPLRVKAVQKLLALPIPEEVDYIFLFGGCLDLACHIYSDVDLYAITSDSDTKAVNRKLYLLFRELGVRIDLLTATKEEFLDRAGDIGTVEHDIQKKGVLIYAKD